MPSSENFEAVFAALAGCREALSSISPMELDRAGETLERTSRVLASAPPASNITLAEIQRLRSELVPVRALASRARYYFDALAQLSSTEDDSLQNYTPNGMPPGAAPAGQVVLHG